MKQKNNYIDLAKVWHSNDEKPVGGKNLLVKCFVDSKLGWNTMQMWYSEDEDLLHFPTEAHIDCPPFLLREIAAWAYIDDLLPRRDGLGVETFGAPDL